MDGSAEFESAELLQRFKFAFSISTRPLILVDQDGTILLTNAPTDELFEFEPGDLFGQPIDILVPEEVRAYHPELRKAFVELPVARSMGASRNLQGVTRTGDRVAIEVGLEPVQAPQNQQWTLVTLTDLSARNRSETKLRSALDAASTAMVMVDRKGDIVLVNRATSRIFDYAANDLIGKPVDVLLPEESRRRHGVFVNSYVTNPARRTMARGRDLTAQRRDGTVFPASITLNPIKTEDGMFFMATVIDVTVSRRTEEEIRRKNRELSSLNEDLMNFAYSASHDLKAPLTTMIGLLRFIEKDIADGDLEEAISNTRGALSLAMRQAERVESVLSLAHSDHGNVDLVQVDLSALLAEVWVGQTRGDAKAPALIEDLKIAGRVMLDQDRMRSVLENLLSNAVKYIDPAKPRSEVRVSAWVEDKHLHLIIADNGVGIAAEVRHRVFRLFTRFAENACDGAGIGLALVRKHVDKMGGTVDFESSPAGTTFTVVLPLKEDSREEQEE